MKKKDESNLHLPGIEPDITRLWHEIDERILTDGLYTEKKRESFENALREIEDARPEREIWSSIEKQLPQESRLLIHKNWFKAGISAAASIIIIFSVYLIFQGPAGTKKISSEKKKEESVDHFIARLCESHPGKCTEADFIEMQDQLLKLQKEKADIENSIFGEQDQQIKRVNAMINIQIRDLKAQISNYVEL
jgi:hypothetical protein